MPSLIDAHHHMWLGVMRRMMPDVDDLFAYIDVVANTLGAHYRPLDMFLSTRLTAVASLDALDNAGIRALLNLDWWKVARGLDMHILTEFIGDLAKLGPEFAKKGVLGPHNIFNHCTRIPPEMWSLFAGAVVNITINPRSDALFGFDDETFAYQQAIDRGLRPALGIDLDTAFGSDMFGEMHALFGQQRSAMRYRKRAGKLIGVDLAKLKADVNASRDYLIETSGYRPALFGGSAAGPEPLRRAV
jgi:cytosine/adenosine deaminase-related metal-dependent hydrolase